MKALLVQMYEQLDLLQPSGKKSCSINFCDWLIISDITQLVFANDNTFSLEILEIRARAIAAPKRY